MNVDKIKNDILNPDLIKHLYGVQISNQFGDTDGRQFIFDVHGLCERYEELKEALEEILRLRDGLQYVDEWQEAACYERSEEIAKKALRQAKGVGEENESK